MRETDIAVSSLPEQQDLIDSGLFSLTTEKFNEFTAMLDAPLSENPGLARLMAVKAPWRADKV